MKVLVRLDVSHKLGTGHWRRMINFLDALNGADALFLLKADDRSNSLFTGFPISWIKNADEEMDVLREAVSTHRPQAIIFDLLHYPKTYIQTVKKAFGLPCISFHEYNDWSPASDLAINYNLFNGFEQERRKNLLAGPEYCIIHEALRSTRRATRPRGVLAMFGGADPSGFGEAFANNVAARLPQIDFTLHTGPFSKVSRGVLAKNITVGQPDKSFFELLAECKVFVTAGGNTMYEAIYMNIKPLVLAHNSHQEQFARNATGLGVADFFGRHPHERWEKLREAVALAAVTEPKPRQRLIDGKGAERIVQAFRQVVA